MTDCAQLASHNFDWPVSGNLSNKGRKMDKFKIEISSHDVNMLRWALADYGACLRKGGWPPNELQQEAFLIAQNLMEQLDRLRYPSLSQSHGVSLK